MRENKANDIFLKYEAAMSIFDSSSASEVNTYAFCKLMQSSKWILTKNESKMDAV